MSTYQSAEEFEQQCLRDMGLDLGRMYYALSNEVTWLHAKWKLYRQLYAHSPERIDLLNGVAGHFFRVVQDVLVDDCVLHLARLVDPAQSRGKDKNNLTLSALPGVIADKALASQVVALTRAARVSCSSAKDWRDRRLAHRELQLALKSRAVPLTRISRKNVEDALAAIRAVLHSLEHHYLDSKRGYELFEAHGDGDALAYHLGVANAAEEAFKSRRGRAVPLPTDLGPERGP